MYSTNNMHILSMLANLKKLIAQKAATWNLSFSRKYRAL